MNLITVIISFSKILIQQISPEKVVKFSKKDATDGIVSLKLRNIAKGGTLIEGDKNHLFRGVIKTMKELEVYSLFEQRLFKKKKKKNFIDACEIQLKRSVFSK